jgi:membrane protein implicated in regulation of membrane protease activity
MDLIILLPAIACWIALAKGPIRKALLNVYLPAVLLLPQYYSLRFPHLPPLTFADAAILPLGAALWVTEMRRWRFDWMDVWVLLLAVSAGLSEGMSTALADGTWKDLFSVNTPPLEGNLADGGLQLFQGICAMVLPYMLGKLLIEQQGAEGQPARKRVIRRMVVLLAIVAGISVFDFLSGRSIWQMVFRHFFAGQQTVWPVQVRWGFGRAAGPFAHAILAGMIFLMGLIYCLWLRAFAPKWGTRKIFSGLPLTVRGLVLGAMIGGLLMTQSRGPWIGVGLALVFALLMWKLPLGKATLAFVLVLTVFSIAAYYYGKRYTDVDINHARSEEQRNAIYRRELIRTFVPIIEERKAFGWGITTLPTLNGQHSIDNEYLLLAATQGLTGLGLFLLILLGSITRLYRLARLPLGMEDKALVFAHLTVLLGLMTALTTVYLGEQALLLLFFIVGWIHGMKPAGAGVGNGNTRAEEFRFQTVLT